MVCPICKKALDDAEREKPKSSYPFCGERCKLIDLGRWLDDRYQISVDREDEDEKSGRGEKDESTDI